MLPAGPSQPLSVVFTPSDPANYATESATVYIDVTLATPMLTGPRTSPAQTNAATVSIAGSVVDGVSNAPVQNVDVKVFDASGAQAGSATTDASGDYSVDGLPEDIYRARTVNGVGYVDELFDNISCALGCDIASGTAISTTAGQASTVNFALLPPGGGIAGAVRDAGTGAPLAGVTVQVFDGGSSQVASAVTTTEGQYLTGDVPTGPYTVRTVNSLGYVDELFDDIQCLVGCDITTGTVVTHAAGVTGSFAEFDLAQGFQIGGTVTASGGGALANVTVDIHDASGVLAASATTNASGVYETAAAVPAGTYFAKTGNAAGYANELYDDIDCAVGCVVTSGTPISTTTLASLGGVDFELASNTPVGTSVAAAPETATGGAAGARDVPGR